MKSVNQVFDEQFSDMAEVAKPLNKFELHTLSEHERGISDCLAGVPHKSDQSEAYNQGYAEQYAQEQEDAD